jgi:hypothetical protein
MIAEVIRLGVTFESGAVDLSGDGLKALRIADPGTGHSAIVGYASDGFGICGARGENGQTLSNAALDECRDHAHSIDWDGATITMYNYPAMY